jgi:hypothetical protein
MKVSPQAIKEVAKQKPKPPLPLEMELPTRLPVHYVPGQSVFVHSPTKKT